MSMLQVAMLGRPFVRWSGCEINEPGGQARALLFRLAAQPDPIPREHLGFLFWPGQSDTSKMRNVTRLCNRLQRLLPISSALVLDEEVVSLNLSQVWSDTILFRQLAEDYNRTPRISLLTALVDLYKGPFLDGYRLHGCVEYRSWIVLARRLWERDYLAALQTLVEQSMAVGDFPLAISMARRYLAVEQADDTMHRHLIELYGLCGDRPAAEKQHERCVQVLRRERGCCPTDATYTAYRSAMAGALDLRQIACQFEPYLEFADHEQGRRQWQYEPKPRRQKILLF